MSDRIVVIWRSDVGDRTYILRSATLEEKTQVQPLTDLISAKIYSTSHRATLTIESDDFTAESHISWAKLAKASGTTVAHLKRSLEEPA